MSATSDRGLSCTNSVFKMSVKSFGPAKLKLKHLVLFLLALVKKGLLERLVATTRRKRLDIMVIELDLLFGISCEQRMQNQSFL